MVAEFIEPLALGTWFVSVLAGSPEVFFALAMLAILSMAMFFRMTMLVTGFMFFTFILMFNDYIPTGLFYLVAIVGALLIGSWVWRFISR